MQFKEKVNFEQLKQSISDSLSIREVHERYSGFQDKSGTMSRCPFCGKKKLYETKHNSLRCYGNCLVQNYDVFSYYKTKFNVNFFQAMINLAKDFGYITEEVADGILNRTYKGESVKINKFAVIENQAKKEKEEETTPLQPINVINNVYEALAMKSPLKENEFIYLRDVRGLDTDRIIKGYFSMPYMYKEKGKQFMDELLSLLNTKYGYTEDNLVGVPGFYRNEDGKMTFISRRGIGMKAINAQGLVNGFQIRSYDSINKQGKLTLSEEKNKYLWGSSRKLQDGCATSSAIDTIIPYEEMYSTLFITEGKFKSEIISKRYISPVVSIPGVGQWRGSLGSEITYINDNIKKINNIFIAFDADMGTNLNVYRELNNMNEEVLSKVDANIKVVVWSERFGKGLDDVILSNNEDKISKVLYKDYIKEYEIFLDELKARYSIKGYNIYYKNTENRVDKEELFKIYSDLVLKPLGVAL